MSCVNLISFDITFAPLPPIFKLVPSVVKVTFGAVSPNSILPSVSLIFIGPCTVSDWGSVSGVSVPITTSPSIFNPLVIFNPPTICVSTCVAPVKNVNSVKATWPPVYVWPVPRVTLKHHSVYLLLPDVTYLLSFAAGLELVNVPGLKDVTVPVYVTPPNTPENVAELSANAWKS